MSPRARMEYLEAIYLRYKKAPFKEKTRILNEFCLNCGYQRKHAIRLLNHSKRFTKPKPKKRGKPSKYHKPSVLKPLKTIWLAANLPCSKRLKVIVGTAIISVGAGLAVGDSDPERGKLHEENILTRMMQETII